MKKTLWTLLLTLALSCNKPSEECTPQNHYSWVLYENLVKDDLLWYSPDPTRPIQWFWEFESKNIKDTLRLKLLTDSDSNIAPSIQEFHDKVVITWFFYDTVTDTNLSDMCDIYWNPISLHTLKRQVTILKSQDDHHIININKIPWCIEITLQ